MGNTLTETKTKTVPAPLWQWRDQYGKDHHPAQMETRHLFHVVRMIWDHAMPPSMQTRFKKRYRFGPYYTREYMNTALRVCFPILIYREDLEPYMKAELDRMYGFIRQRHPAIPAPLLELNYVPETTGSPT